MSELYIVKAKKTDLKSPLSTTANQVILRELVDSQGNDIAMASFGAFGVVVLTQSTTVEMIKFDNFSRASDGTVTLSVATNGRDISPITPYTGSSTGQKFNSTADAIITNDPLTMMKFALITNANTWDLLQIFSTTPETTGGNASTPNGLVRKAQLDTAILGIVTSVSIVVEGNAGETLADGDLIYLKSADDRWWKADADTASTVENVILGIAQGAGTAGNQITNGIMLRGVDDAQSGLTAGTKYYASNTAGDISSSAGTKEVTVGIAKSTTELYFEPRFDQMLTEDQQDALELTNTLTATNKVLSQKDFQIGAEIYGASAVGTDAYAFTYSPVPILTVGMEFTFKADVANTGACTFNPNTLGAQAIVKKGNVPLETGDIVANQMVRVKWDGTNYQMISPSVDLKIATASDVLRLSADTNRNHNNDGTVKVKETRVTYGGIIRVKFAGQGNGFGGQGRIYVNGVATGTLRSFANGSYTTYSEDITINASDLVQIYSIATGGSVTDIKEFRIYFDLANANDGTVITD